MKKNGLIIFDMDGTLLYTLEDLTDSVNFALEKCNLPKKTIEEIRFFVGNGVHKLIERAVCNNEDKIDECFQIFKEHYKNNSANKTKPYNNTIKCLKELKKAGLLLAILSNKPDSEVKKLSKKYFGDIFDISMGESEEFSKKPDTKALNYIIDKYKMAKDEVFFVGDSEVDIMTAKNGKIPCLSVTYGYKTREFLTKHGACNLFDNFEQLCEYIMKTFS